MHIHSYRDLNSVSSSTDNINRLGHIPSSWRIPAPRVDLRRAAASSSGGNTSRSVKPAALNSLELIIIATGICKKSTFSVGFHSSHVRPDAFSSTRFNHRLITRARLPSWLVVAFLTWNSNLVPLLEGLCTSNPCRFEFSGFMSFCRNRTDNLGIDSPALWPTELVLHRLG